MKKLIFVIFLLSFNAMGANWTINQDHSEVMFQVPYLQVSEVTGRFTEFKGDVSFNGDIIDQVMIEIDSASIDTANKMRDGHLKGADFLQSTEYPKISFTGRSVTPTGKDTYRAKGDLTIKNITRPVDFQFTLTKSVKDTWGHENRFVKFRSAISKKSFNINWNKTLNGEELLIGDEIALSGVFQLQPVGDKTPNSKHMIPDTKIIRDRDTKKQESGFSKKLRDLINGK